jgi:nitrate reductase NapAB chaperone NapD
MDKHIIVGVHVVDRNAHAAAVQHIFTKYGCQIKTRIGLHDVHDDYCSPNGLIVLEMLDTAETGQMIDALQKVEGIVTQTMVFDH